MDLILQFVAAYIPKFTDSQAIIVNRMLTDMFVPEESMTITICNFLLSPFEKKFNTVCSLFTQGKKKKINKITEDKMGVRY